jgi:hypothetical protein
MDLVFEGNPGCTTMARVRDGGGVKNANCGALRAMVGSVEALIPSGCECGVKKAVEMWRGMH